MKYLKILLIIFFLINLTSAVKGEDIGEIEVKIKPSFTIEELAKENKIPPDKLLKGLSLKEKDTDKTLEEAGKSEEEAIKIIRKLIVLEKTDSSKNWMQILSKFILWAIAIVISTVLLIKKKVSRKVRLIWMAGAALLFGFIYGSDPNPMGTVKDAIVLYGKEGIIFPPRMIAFLIFLLFVFISNKSICSWGCHLGALQDCIYFIPLKKKIKLPFVLTNGIRICAFIFLIISVFLWKFDWMGEIDPFKIFNITHWQMTLAGIIFFIFILISSLFFYRPWCQLFCPFGLTGWLVEQFSILKPKIRRDPCIKCKKCITVCPTQAMNGIYHGSKIRADCFGCGNCVRECRQRLLNGKGNFKATAGFSSTLFPFRCHFPFSPENHSPLHGKS